MWVTKKQLQDSMGQAALLQQARDFLERIAIREQFRSEIKSEIEAMVRKCGLERYYISQPCLSLSDDAPGVSGAILRLGERIDLLFNYLGVKIKDMPQKRFLIKRKK